MIKKGRALRIREIDYVYCALFAMLFILKNLVNPVQDFAGFDKLSRFWTSGSPGGRLYDR